MGYMIPVSGILDRLENKLFGKYQKSGRAERLKRVVEKPEKHPKSREEQT